jgi:hypothetical protein
MDLKGVEIFRTGVWNGKRFDLADLEAIVASFDELKLGRRAVPLKLGHREQLAWADGQPSLGWVERLWLDGETVMADFGGMPKIVHSAIRDGLYSNVSVELLPGLVEDGKEYKWTLTAVALLGSDIPAVSGLRDLTSLLHSRRLAYASGERLHFTINNGGRDSMDDVQKLKAENERLNGMLVQQAQDTAITSGRCIPAERERFNRRYGKAGTLTDWNEWLKDAQRPPAHMARQGGNGRVHDSHADTMPEGDAPDAELVTAAQALVEKSGGKIDYFSAQRQVLRANPDLAERYRMQPGTRE